MLVQSYLWRSNLLLGSILNPQSQSLLNFRQHHHQLRCPLYLEHHYVQASQSRIPILPPSTTLHVPSLLALAIPWLCLLSPLEAATVIPTWDCSTHQLVINLPKMMTSMIVHVLKSLTPSHQAAAHTHWEKVVGHRRLVEAKLLTLETHYLREYHPSYHRLPQLPSLLLLRQQQLLSVHLILPLIVTTVPSIIPSVLSLLVLEIPWWWQLSPLEAARVIPTWDYMIHLLTINLPRMMTMMVAFAPR